MRTQTIIDSPVQSETEEACIAVQEAPYSMDKNRDLQKPKESKMSKVKYTLAIGFPVFSRIVVPITLFIVPAIYIDSFWLFMLVATPLIGLWRFIRLFLEPIVLYPIVSDLEEQPQENFQPENMVTSKLAIASLVLGICGYFTLGLGNIVGLVLGFVALSKITNSNGQLSGRGLAIGGIIISIIVLSILAIAFFLGVFGIL